MEVGFLTYGMTIYIERKTRVSINFESIIDDFKSFGTHKVLL